MATQWTDVLRELAGLRSRGVWDEHLPRDLGPILRGVTGIDAGTGIRRSQELFADFVRRHAERIPDTGLRAGALTALGLEPGTEELRFLGQRRRWLSDREGFSESTARRRMDDGLAALARRIAGDEPTQDGWYVELLSSRVSLISGSLEAIEERRIRTTVGGLRELVHRTSVPRARASAGQHGLGVELLSGGILEDHPSSTTHFQYRVLLGRELATRDRHTYTVRNRIPAGQVILPHYLCVPFRRYDRFDLTMRFDPGRLPARVHRVERVIPRLLEDRQDQGEQEPGEPLTLDPDGSVEVSFTALSQGFGYGLVWSWT